MFYEFYHLCSQPQIRIPIRKPLPARLSISTWFGYSTIIAPSSLNVIRLTQFERFWAGGRGMRCWVQEDLCSTRYLHFLFSQQAPHPCVLAHESFRPDAKRKQERLRQGEARLALV